MVDDFCADAERALAQPLTCSAQLHPEGRAAASALTTVMFAGSEAKRWGRARSLAQFIAVGAPAKGERRGRLHPPMPAP